MVSTHEVKKVLTLALVEMAVIAMALAAPVAAGASGTSSAAAGDRKQAQAQVDFGNKVAEQGLWKEAIYRWERAVQLDPSYAAAFNNLAIGYETAGQFDKAKAAYERALELDPKNAVIRQNFDLFKEVNDRANRKPTR